MPPKTKFTQTEIVDTAFEIAREEGIDNITIRKVAQKLGSSIAPIYVNFKTIDELKQAVLEKVYQLTGQLLKEPYTDHSFLNVGIASMRFAREYPVLFRDLVINGNAYKGNNQPDRGSVFEQMRQDPDLEGFTEQQLTDILFKMQVFTIGLSVMNANSMLPEGFDEKMQIDLLADMGVDVIEAERMRRRQKNNEQA